MGEGAGLRRSLGLPLLTLYGLGNIVGAGIYVLIGKVAGLAGSSTTLSFIIAMVTAGVTALSYMELSGRYPVSASVSVYLHKAFGKRWLSVAIGLAMVVGGVASAAALAQGFAGYLQLVPHRSDRCGQCRSARRDRGAGDQGHERISQDRSAFHRPRDIGFGTGRLVRP